MYNYLFLCMDSSNHANTGNANCPVVDEINISHIYGGSAFCMRVHPEQFRSQKYNI